jgi:hypothetical protein
MVAIPTTDGAGYEVAVELRRRLPDRCVVEQACRFVD